MVISLLYSANTRFFIALYGVFLWPNDDDDEDDDDMYVCVLLARWNGPAADQATSKSISTGRNALLASLSSLTTAGRHRVLLPPPVNLSSLL